MAFYCIVLLFLVSKCNLNARGQFLLQSNNRFFGSKLFISLNFDKKILNFLVFRFFKMRVVFALFRLSSWPSFLFFGFFKN